MTLVEWGIVSTFVFVLGLTVVAAINKQETVSTTLQRWATNSNWFGLLFGTLIGHWFMPDAPHKIISWPIALIPILLVGILDFGDERWWHRPKWSKFPGWWVLLGILNGAFLWGSNS